MNGYVSHLYIAMITVSWDLVALFYLNIDAFFFVFGCAKKFWCFLQESRLLTVLQFSGKNFILFLYITLNNISILKLI